MRSPYLSGRQDSNLRPLDPQDVGVGISTGQTGCRRRSGERSTCGLFVAVQDVWSPSGPQQDAPPTTLPPPRPGRPSRRGAGVNGGRRPSHSDAKRHLLRHRDVDDRQAGEGETRKSTSSV